MYHKSTLLRTLLGFIFLVSVGTIKGQTPLDSVQAIYDSLPATLYPSQILHNRSPKYLWSFTVDSTLQWQVNNNYTSSPYLYPGDVPAPVIEQSDWQGIYGELKVACTNPLLIPDKALLNTRDSLAKVLYEVPIGTLHMDFHRILPGATDSGYLYFDTLSETYTLMPDTLWMDKPNNVFHYTANSDSLAQLAMEVNEVFVGVLTQPVVYKKGMSFSVTFGLVSSLFIENQTDQVTYVEMDFDDGNGFVSTPFDVPKTVTYSFASGMENYQKNLRLRLHYGAKTVETRMKFHAVPNNSGADEVYYASSLPYTCPVPTNGHIPGQARISVRYGNSQGKILKPILMVEGFESSLKDYGVITYHGLSSGFIYDNGKRVYDHMTLMKNTLDSLHALGYDIIYQDNFNGRAAIQANALNTIKIVQWVNAELQANESHEKPVVIGASMGGLIVRYALSKMEADGCCHNTRLYGTFDSPHNGAHIPVGLQTMVKHIHDDLGWIDGVFGIEKVKPNWADVLNSIAARQMLVAHIGADAKADREAFMTEFDSLGHPQQCRQIAIVNGSEQGLANAIVDANKTYVLCQPHIWLPTAHHVGTSWQPFANIVGIPIPFRTMVMNAFAESNPSGVVFQGNDVIRASKLAALIVATHGVSVYLQVFIGFPMSLTPVFGAFGNALIFTCQGVSNISLPGMHALNLIDDVFLSGSQTYISSGNQNYSESPGSTTNTPESISKAFGSIASLITPNHSFIPSVSALDLDTNDLYWNLTNDIDYVLNMTPFDTYWAPGRGDDPSVVDYNMNHIEVTEELYRWLITQIDHNDDLRDGISGDYHKNLSGYYNFGRTADFEDPFLKHLYSVTIEYGGNLHINTDGPIGYLASAYTAPQGGSFTCYTGQNCENPHIKIKDGGLFEVGRTLTNNRADMIFRPSSTLEILPGGTLRVHDLSRLVIEEGAELIIHPGAVINLMGEESEMVLEGLVRLKPHANFTFQGNGFVRFNQATQMKQSVMDQYWAFEGDNRIALNGNNKKQDVLAVISSDLHLSGALDTLILTDGSVLIEDDRNLSVRGAMTFNNVLFYSSDTTSYSSYYGHVLAFGQPGISIENSSFVGGQKGLYLMNVLGQPNGFQELIALEFRRCGVGLLTESKSVAIKNSSFSYNVDGWVAKNMSENCQALNVSFSHQGSTGIEYFGQSSSLLSLKSCDFEYNYDGVYVHGSNVRSDCSQYLSNTESGLVLKSGIAYLNHNAGNTFYNNQQGIFLHLAGGFSVEDGYNAFSSNVMDITGTFDVSAILDLYLGLPAINLLNNSFASGPISLPISLTVSGRPVAIYNYTPLFTTPCLSIGGTGKTLGDMAEDFTSDQVFVSVGKSSSSGVFYNSGDAIDLSIQESLDLISNHNQICDDLEASSRLQELLNSGFYPNTYSEEQLYELAYQGVLLATSNAYLLNNLSSAKDSPLPSPELINAMDIIDHRVSNHSALDTAHAEKVFTWQLDKALLLRTAQHYSMALEILDSLLLSPPNTDAQLTTDRWKCICLAEQSLLDSTLALEDYFIQINNCHNSFASKRGEVAVGFQTPLSFINTYDRFATLMPNPTEETSRLVFHGEHLGGKVTVFDVMGRVIRTYFVGLNQPHVSLRREEPGNYLLKISLSGQAIEIQKWLVIP